MLKTRSRPNAGLALLIAVLSQDLRKFTAEPLSVGALAFVTLLYTGSVRKPCFCQPLYLSWKLVIDL